MRLDHLLSKETSADEESVVGPKVSKVWKANTLFNLEGTRKRIVENKEPNESPAQRVSFGEEEQRSDMKFLSRGEAYGQKRNERSLL